MSKAKKLLARRKANRKLMAERAAGVAPIPKRPRILYPPFQGTISRKQAEAAVEAVMRMRTESIPAS